MADRTLTINHADGGSETYTINRDKFAGVREMSRGHVYPTIMVGSFTDSTGSTLTKADEQTFTIVSSSTTANSYINFVNQSNGIRMGKHRIAFDLTLNSGSLSTIIGYYSDTDSDPSNGNSYGQYVVTEGSNVIDFEIFDDGVSNTPNLFWLLATGSTCDISVTNLKITHEPDAVTVDHTAVPKHQSKETTLGGSQSITIKRDIEPLLSKVVGGAAAAYSLRDLHDTTGVNKVVRVRRESDNNERDFNAKEVSNGTLQNWTNAQVTPPLDVRELTATGRDGPIIEAAAAYSLRNLSDSYTGSVVEVRRTSDSAVQSFTASEVTDGTLTTWVSEAPIAQNSTSNPYTTFTNASTTEFTATLSSGVSFAGFGNVEGSSGDSVTVSFDLNIVSGSPRLALRASSSSIPDVSNGVSYTSSGSYSLTMFATGDFGFIGFSEGDSPSEFTVSNFKITSVSGATYVRDGTVSKWYDQSTTSGVPNAKHAVQTDAAYQPKIVDGGALVTNAEGNPAIQGATGKSFGLSAITGLEDVSIFFVGAVPPSFEAITGWDTNLHMIRFSSSTWEFVANTTDPGNMGWNSALTSGDTALFNFTRSSGTVTGYANSVASATTSNANSNPFGLNRIFTRSNVNYNDYKGKASELIIYPSDQSDNRTALEANIGEVYSIAGIPAYDNTVNGFVETWYDQSGNGNNATQLTAGSQPKIVSAGTLVTGGIDFDGVDDYFQLNLGADLAQPNSFFMVHESDSLDYAKNEFFDAVGTSPRTLIDSTGGAYRLAAPTDFPSTLTLDLAQKTVVGVFVNSTSSFLSKNGEISATSDAGTAGVNQFSHIGHSFTRYYVGKMDEFIIYNSDQSANRLAIEANINNQYDIY